MEATKVRDPKQTQLRRSRKRFQKLADERGELVSKLRLIERDLALETRKLNSLKDYFGLVHASNNVLALITNFAADPSIGHKLESEYGPKLMAAVARVRRSRK